MFRIPILLLLVCALLMAAACQKQPAIPEPQLQALPTQELLARGDAALGADDYGQSLSYYREALTRTDLLGDMRAKSYERATRSALGVRDHEQALDFLRGWASLDPKVKRTWPWNEYQAQALEGLGLDDMLQDHLAGLIISRSVSWDVRRNAALFQADHFMREGRPMAAAPALREVYDTAPSRDAKAILEQALLLRLLDHEPKQVAKLMDAGGQEQPLAFPHTIMRLAAARALAETKPGRWDAAWRELRSLLARGQFADETLARATLRALEREHGTLHTGIALAVPLSDKIGAIGWKIVAGAMIAQRQLAEQGQALEVRVVNTSRKGWLTDLAALPPGFAVVGGPILRDDFQQAVHSGLTGDRVFMTFLQSLGDAEEGRTAWRFFASPQDQVRALLDLAGGKYGLREFGVLAPQEPFGTYMTEVFSQEVWDRGLTVAAYGTYPPKSPPAWGGKVADLLGIDASKSEQATQTPPDPGFRAVFLPDGWNQAQLLAPQFYYYEAEDTLLLGSELWSQALLGGTDADLSYFGLAVCPGAWWSQSQRPAVRELTRRMAESGLGQPDFWNALGYDFVRFASGLGNLPGGWDSRTVNERLASAPPMAWSLAPMSWTRQGKARQDLFLFQPSRKGLVPVNADELHKRMEQARIRHDERLEMRRAKLEEREKAARAAKPQGAAQ